MYCTQPSAVVNYFSSRSSSLKVDLQRAVILDPSNGMAASAVILDPSNGMAASAVILDPSNGMAASVEDFQVTQMLMHAIVRGGCTIPVRVQ